MNANMIPFEFEGAAVRVIDRAGEPWFVLADVCRVLEIENSRNVSARLDDDEKGVHTMDTPGGEQSLTIINESGLYSLVLTSRKAAARRFKKWVTAEVLPTIRKTGAYILRPQVPALDLSDPWDQPVAVISARLRVIAQANRIYGPGAARELWRKSGLPQVEEAEPVGEEIFDAEGCLAHLLRFATLANATVGDLVDAAQEGQGDDLLAEIGVRVGPSGFRGMVAIAERGRALAMIYRNTVWRDGGWPVGLAGLSGARRAGGVMFAARKSAAVLVPLAHVNRAAGCRAA